MAHSIVKNWIHLVFGTRDSARLINSSIEGLIYTEIKKQFTEMNCYVEIISGDMDHVHVLFMLNPEYALRKVIKQIKGGSAYCVNRIDKLDPKIYWQTGYGAFSVSQSQFARVKAYIANQKAHHARISYQDEYELFLRRNGFKNG